MEFGRTLMFIQQWLKENHLDETLSTLELESSIEYAPSLYERGSELQTILDEHAQRKLQAEASPTEESERLTAAEEELLAIPDEPLVSTLSQTFNDIHESNIIALKSSPHDPSQFASGGAAGELVIANLAGEVLSTIQTGGQGALTCADFHPLDKKYCIVGHMGGMVCLIDLETQQAQQVLKEHTKFVTRALWAPCGTRFATCGHDKAVVVYHKDESTGAWAKQGSKPFVGIVEGLAWASAATLVATIRDDNYMHYIDAATLEDRKVNMNVAGDDYVSFTVMDMRISPDGKYILAATDRNRTILMPVGVGQTHLRVFYGANNDEWSTPRVCWSPSGRYVCSTAQDDSIAIWDIQDQKLVTTLTGHTQNVKAIDFCQGAEQPTLLSVSFDKTVRVWSI